VAVRVWKGPLKWIGNLAMVGGLLGVLVHYVRFGRKDHQQHDVASDQSKP
jgi:hypothetical protein